MSVLNHLMVVANKTHSALYRRYDRDLVRTMRGVPLLLITVPGRRSGTPHTTPVGYVVDGEALMVCGSGGGLPEEPQWFRNLRHTETAHVEVGHEAFDVSVHVPEGAERDRLLERYLERAPVFAGYQHKIERRGGTRTLPVAVLRRV